MLVFFYIYSHPNRPLVSPCNESTISVMRIYVEPPRGSSREQESYTEKAVRSRIRDGGYLVHRTRTVDYLVLKGLSLIALIGFFIV